VPRVEGCHLTAHRSLKIKFVGEQMWKDGTSSVRCGGVQNLVTVFIRPSNRINCMGIPPLAIVGWFRKLAAMTSRRNLAYIGWLAS